MKFNTKLYFLFPQRVILSISDYTVTVFALDEYVTSIIITPYLQSYLQ